MKALTEETTLDGIAQKLPELSNQLVAIFDKALVLEIYADWYYEPDSQWGGPPSKESLLALSNTLQQTYKNIAALTGLDQCEQFKQNKRN